MIDLPHILARPMGARARRSGGFLDTLCAMKRRADEERRIQPRKTEGDQ